MGEIHHKITCQMGELDSISQKGFRTQTPCMFIEEVIQAIEARLCGVETPMHHSKRSSGLVDKLQ